MPLRRRDPVPEEAMYYVSPKNTICEKLREIYHASQDQDVRYKAREATAMAKAMNDRLVELTGEKELFKEWGSHGHVRDKLSELSNKAVRAGSSNKLLDVVVLTRDDWANSMWRYTKCLQMLGLRVMCFKGAPHPFKYAQQAPIHPSLTGQPISAVTPLTVMAHGIEPILEAAHVIVLHGSMFPSCRFDWARRNVVVQHGGSVYRNAPELNNRIFNKIASDTIVQCPDLLGLGAKNEHLIYYPVDTDAIQPVYKSDDKPLIIGHFPRHPEIKGSKLVYGVIEKLKKEFNFEYFGWYPHNPGDVVSWEENLMRMSKCDIIIETVNPDINGKVYGEWGNTALEAAALGKVVITNCRNITAYNEHYGDMEMSIANNSEELEHALRWAFSVPFEAFRETQEWIRNWAVDKHSMQATAKRMWEEVYQKFFV